MGHRRGLSTRRQIRNLIVLIGGAIFTALFVALGLLHVYGPSGTYQAKYLLFAPEFYQLYPSADSEQNEPGGPPFVFDTIEFNYYDPTSQQWKKKFVDKEHYEKFYNAIASDSSLKESPSSVINLFDTNYNSSLTLIGRINEKNGEGTKKKFQVIEFDKGGDYYRMELQNPKETDVWIYFSHPGILKEAISILS